MSTSHLLQPADSLPAPGAAPAAPPPAPVAGTAADAPAGDAPGPMSPFGGGMGMMIMLMVTMFGVMWWMGRGDKKRREELESKLKKGDRVVTRSGLIGKLLDVGERKVRLEIAPGVNVSMLKVAVEGLDEAATSSEDSAGKK